MGRIDDLLDEMGVTNPMVRALLAEAIYEEMSIPFDTYMQKKGKVHTKAQCRETRKAGGPKNCVIHKPSLHRLTGARQILRSSGLIEDQCEHGIGHPNPDSAAYFNWLQDTDSWFVHGCDGCCGPLQQDEVSKYDYLEGDYPV